MKIPITAILIWHPKADVNQVIIFVCYWKKYCRKEQKEMTDNEYFQNLVEFHTKNLKRSSIPKEEFDNKEYFKFQKEYTDFLSDQQQEEKELDNKIHDCVEDTLADLLKDFNSNINIKL